MKHSEVLKMVDHTLLAQTATWEEIRQICDDGLRYGTASVCIPPCYVAAAAEYVQGKLPICTVIGFPNGNHTTEAKIYEAQNAIANGASELDMVINIGALKAKNYEYVQNEIEKLKEVCDNRILKVIIETCLLSEEEKIKCARSSLRQRRIISKLLPVFQLAALPLTTSHSLLNM